MKKRMQTFFPTLLVLVFFLFSGLNGLEAQSLSPSPVVTQGPDKTTIDYRQGMDAITTLRAEMDSQFDLLNPPQDENTAANRIAIYKSRYFIAIQGKIGTGYETGSAIIRAYNEALAINEKYTGLVNETWLNEAIDILSL